MPGAEFMIVDIKDFYYDTPMSIYEYMALPLALIPQEIISQYKLNSIAHNDIVYIKIRKGIPGLKQYEKTQMTGYVRT